SRCVYVDNEPVAAAHAQVLLERHGDPQRHAVIQGDLRDPDTTWRRARETGVLDPHRPLGLIIVGVLYFFGPDEDPHAIVAPGGTRVESDGTARRQPRHGERHRRTRQEAVILPGGTPWCGSVPPGGHRSFGYRFANHRCSRSNAWCTASAAPAYDSRT